MDSTEALKIFWYAIFIASVIFYCILDGFDLGVGMLQLWHKKDIDRRICLNAIGPVWDGNEVWLVILVGSLFAGFAGAYATLLSTFYIPTTVFIAALIFRAVAIEFRSKQESKKWRAFWDFCFFLGSLVIAFGAGLVLGNLISGLPLDENFEYAGKLADLFHPYALLVGVMGISCFIMHGAIYLVMKTEKELQDRIRRLIPTCLFFFGIMYITVTVITLFFYPHMTQRMRDHEVLFALPLLSFCSLLMIVYHIKRRNDGWAFICSCLSIALLLVLFAVGIFPYLLYSTQNPLHNSVTVYNAGASKMTLVILSIIVAIGLPLVFSYGILLYRIFRGKVRMDKMSY